MKNTLFLAFLLLLSNHLNAQYLSDKQISFPRLPVFDSNLLKPDSSAIKKNYVYWIVPGAMITYGFLTVHVDDLTDINENVKETVWTKAPHSGVTIDSYLQFAPAVAVFTLNIAGVHGEHNLMDATMLYALSNIILGVTVFSLKNITHEQRPDGSNDQSFPSGHTAEAFASAEFLRQEYKNLSPWYGIGGYLTAATVAYLRIYNNKHWFNDVVAGAGFGIISTRLSYLLYPKIKRLFTKYKMPDSMILPYYQDKTVGLHFVHSFR